MSLFYSLVSGSVTGTGSGFLGMRSSRMAA
jgi:hypothetical protein